VDWRLFTRPFSDPDRGVVTLARGADDILVGTAAALGMLASGRLALTPDAPR
jgi:hypothetical protein